MMKTTKIFLSILLLTLLITHNSVYSAERIYWIAAEKVAWNYAPSRKNLIKPGAGMGVWGKKLIYRKYRYIQYTDSNFNKIIKAPESMGILGPQIRAVEGDTIKVHFYNKTDKPLSMHPHGVNYEKKSEGADSSGKGAEVRPGEKYTYHWQADADSAPGANDPSSIVWLYHSHVDPVKESYDGLIGTIVITKKGYQRSDQDPRPKDIDVEFTTLFMVFNENKANAKIQHEGELKHSINGYIFGNLKGLTATKGQKIRWYLLAMGTEIDMHTAHWHGKTVVENGRRTDVVELLPASMKTVDMVANNPGSWLYHCHVNDHITAGMSARWQIK